MLRTTLSACVAFMLSACAGPAAKLTDGAVPRDAYGKPVLTKVP